MKRKLALALAGMIVALGAIGAWWVADAYASLHEPIAALRDATTYEVPRGASWKGTLDDLRQRGLIARPRQAAIWMRFMRPAQKLIAGEYQLEPGMSALDLMDLLQSGRVLMHSLTIVEGGTFADLRRALRGREDLRATLVEVSDAEIMRRLGAEGVHPEGQFFPDTYRFAKGASDWEILRMAHRRMQLELTRAWAMRDPETPLVDAAQALILASIVEKETALSSERPLIAGVFVERLTRGMRLQTDPSVIYGLGERYDGNIRKRDLLADTPYNTYTRAGLPPTPICLPGSASLQAAVRPKRSGELFFVATGRGDGSHYFSKSYDEHQAAVQRYLRTMRQRR